MRDYPICVPQTRYIFLRRCFYEKRSTKFELLQALADDTTSRFNLDQLEACDDAPDDDSRLIVIDGKTKTLVKEVLKRPSS